MPPPRPACCRVVHRPNAALPSSDSIWVSDSLLLSTFQHFCAASKSTRRHGSFVPGPLECRRRMGKRQMGYRSDAIPPIYGARNPWGWFGEIKNLSWQWQAPTSTATRSTRKDIVIRLPRWLTRWPFPPDSSSSPELKLTSGRLPEDATFGKERLLEFQQALLDPDAEKSEICAQFNRYLSQCITIGSVDEALLCETLSLVTDEIRLAFNNATIATSKQLAFYQAVWDGISSCKILSVCNLQATTLDQFLQLISALPVSLRMRALAFNLLSSVSAGQLDGMNSSIQSLVNSWILSWFTKVPIQSYGPLMVAAKDAVGASELAFQNSGVLNTVMLDCPARETDVAKALGQLKPKVLSGINAIKQCEDALYPVRSSIIDLANCIQRLAPNFLDRIITFCVDHVSQLYQADAEERRLASQVNIRIAILSLVARLPNTSRELFVKTWQAMDTTHWRVPEDLGSDLILAHMTTQGYVKDPVGLRNIFEALSTQPTMKEYRLLLVALQTQDKDWSGAGYLVGLLNELDKQWQIFKALTAARERHIVPPLELLRATLSSVAIFNPRIAFNIYNMYIPYTYRIQRLDLSQCQDFVISMIHDDSISPKNIWRVLGIPIYENLRKGSRYRPLMKPKSPLSPAYVELLTSMATAFSRSKARPQRVAFRNVSQCLRHLQEYGIPISVEMSRAISYSGITREIHRQNWIGEARLQWILSIVEAGEGREVAETVQAAVAVWRRQVEKMSINTRYLRVK